MYQSASSYGTKLLNRFDTYPRILAAVVLDLGPPRLSRLVEAHDDVMMVQSIFGPAASRHRVVLPRALFLFL